MRFFCNETIDSKLPNLFFNKRLLEAILINNMILCHSNEIFSDCYMKFSFRFSFVDQYARGILNHIDLIEGKSLKNTRFSCSTFDFSHN